MNYTITNAAHKYPGMDSSQWQGSTASYGDITGVNYSVDLSTVRLFQTVGASATFSGGYTETISMYVSSPTTAVITALGMTRTATGESMFSASGSLTVSVSNLASFTDLGSLFSGNDTITGNDYSNFLQGYGGNDVINGGGGYDTAVMRGSKSQYTVTRGADGLPTRISGGSDGTDTLVSIERIAYTDGVVAYDINGNAGQAYRLYKAAFDRTPDAVGLRNWTYGLDAGLSLRDAAKGFIESAEFRTKFGAPDNTGFVTLLYQNVLHRAPDARGLADWKGGLDAGMSRADVLVGFSESAENQAAVIGVIKDGISFPL